MFKENYTKPKVMITETRTYKLWESAGRKIVEAQLTPDQIQQIFQGAQNIETAGGANRTMIGKGKDAATAVGQAWEELKTKAQTSKPIDGFEKKYDALANRLKQATGGDQGAMKYVQYYRDFAKKHPIAQGVVYAALIAAIGLSGAGLGGAAALGLFKMTDKLLQGDKFTSAAYSGAKTGGLAYGASQLGQQFKGADAVSSAGVSTADAVPSTSTATDAIGSATDTATSAVSRFDQIVDNAVDYKIKQGDTLSQILADRKINPEAFYRLPGNDVYFSPDGNPNIIKAGQTIKLPDPADILDLNKMSGTTPSDPNLAKGYGDTNFYTGVYNQNSALGLDAKNNLQQQDFGRLGSDNGMSAARIAQDAGGQTAGPSQAEINQMRNQNLFRMQDQADAAYYADKPDDVGINQRNNDAVGTGMPGSAKPFGVGYSPEYLEKAADPNRTGQYMISPEKAQAALDWQAQNGGQVPNDAPPAIDNSNGFSKEYLEKAADPNRTGKYLISPEKAQQLLGQMKESIQLSESQIFLLIGKIVERHRRIDEGIMDTIKGAAGKTADWARTKGQNLTTKITADKLLQAWKKSGSPTDSDDVSKVMVGAGVPQETVTNLMKNFVQGPSAGTNTNVWQGADRSIPAIQRKQQGQSFAATPNASGQTPTPQGQTPAPAPQGQLPAPQGQTQEPTQDNLPLRYYGAGNKSPTDFWGRKRPVQPTMQSQQRQAALDAANAAPTTSTPPTTPTTTPAPQGTTYDPTNAAANRLAKGQAAQQQALKQMAATQKANSPISQQYSTIKAAATAALAKPGFEQTAADKLAIKQAAANNIIQMPKNTTTAPTTKVAEGEFAGHYATGVAGQWRNKGPKANKPATIGDLVGESEENKNNNKEDRFSRFMDKKYKKGEEVGRVNNPPIKGTPNTAKTGYYPTPKPPVKKLDTPLANETVAEGSEDLARILHIAGIKK
jgi:hypothetical protein